MTEFLVAIFGLVCVALGAFGFRRKPNGLLQSAAEKAQQDKRAELSVAASEKIRQRDDELEQEAESDAGSTSLADRINRTAE